VLTNSIPRGFGFGLPFSIPHGFGLPFSITQGSVAQGSVAQGFSPGSQEFNLWDLKTPKTQSQRAFTPFLQKIPKKIFVFHPSLLFTFTS
jgi:hypothetical protein